MSLRINLNSAALNAHRQLQSTDSALSASIEKLSSGFRINRAADDPAGLAISEGLRAQISGLGQAIKNSNDAVNMIKTAEGALAEVHSLLRNMRNLAVHAASPGSLDDTAIAADQSQIDAAVAALNRIATNTAFGNKKLLDGSGALGATIFSTGVASSVSLAASDKSTDNGVTGLVTGYADLHITQVAQKATLQLDDVADAYDAVGDTVSNAGTITINGQAITIDAADTVTSAMAKINDISVRSITGVTASAETVGGKIQLKLDHAEYGSSNLIVYSESAAIFNNQVLVQDAGQDAQGHIVQGAVTTNFNSGSGNVLESANGSTITLNGAGAVADTASALYLSGSALTFQIGANSGETTEVSIAGTSASLLGVNALDVVTDAEGAIDTIDDAIAAVSTMRADLGSAQKNMEATINSLSISKENIAASESSIRDTDMAEEMVTFTRNQILLQAGTAMLTQANAAPQALLALLQG